MSHMLRGWLNRDESSKDFNFSLILSLNSSLLPSGWASSDKTMWGIGDAGAARAGGVSESSHPDHPSGVASGWGSPVERGQRGSRPRRGWRERRWP